MEQPHQQLEHYDFAKTVGKGIHAALFPKRWTGKNNGKRVKNAKKTMDELSRHRTHWATFEEVVSRIIPTWINVLELLPDVRPAQELRQLEQEALTGLSPEQLQLMEQSAELGRTRALAFRQLSDETESAWFERMHNLDTATLSEATAKLSADDHSAFEAEVERQLKHYMEILPVADDTETIRRREECRTQLSFELNEAEKEGLTWRQLHAWRQHRVWREQYGEDLEAWDEYVLQVLEANDLDLTDEQLEAWRLHQLNRERNGLDWETLQLARQEISAAEHLKLSAYHLQVWRHHQTRCELEDAPLLSLEAVLQGHGRPAPGFFTPEVLGAWLHHLFMRQYLGLNTETVELNRAIVEAKSWSKSNLPADYLGVWWVHQSRREAAGFVQESPTTAQDIARVAKREGVDALDLDLQLSSELLRKITGLPLTLERGQMKEKEEGEDPRAGRIFATHVSMTERMRHFVNDTLDRTAKSEQAMQMQPPSSEELSDAQRVGLTGAARNAWLVDNAMRIRVGLDPRAAIDAKQDWLECRRRQVTLMDLATWWEVQTDRQTKGLDREDLEICVDEAKQARRYGVDLSYWWCIQSHRLDLGLQRARLVDWARATREARRRRIGSALLLVWGLLQVEREAADLKPQKWTAWVRQVKEAESHNMSYDAMLAWQWMQLERERHGMGRVSLSDYLSEAKVADQLGVASEVLVDWWSYRVKQESRGFQHEDLPTWAARQRESVS